MSDIKLGSSGLEEQLNSSPSPDSSQTEAGKPSSCTPPAAANGPADADAAAPDQAQQYGSAAFQEGPASAATAGCVAPAAATSGAVQPGPAAAADDVTDQQQPQPQLQDQGTLSEAAAAGSDASGPASPAAAQQAYGNEHDVASPAGAAAEAAAGTAEQCQASTDAAAAGAEPSCNSAGGPAADSEQQQPVTDPAVSAGPPPPPPPPAAAAASQPEHCQAAANDAAADTETITVSDTPSAGTSTVSSAAAAAAAAAAAGGGLAMPAGVFIKRELPPRSARPRGSLAVEYIAQRQQQHSLYSLSYTQWQQRQQRQQQQQQGRKSAAVKQQVQFKVEPEVQRCSSVKPGKCWEQPPSFDLQWAWPMGGPPSHQQQQQHNGPLPGSHQQQQQPALGTQPQQQHSQQQQSQQQAEQQQGPELEVLLAYVQSNPDVAADFKAFKANWLLQQQQRTQQQEEPQQQQQKQQQQEEGEEGQEGAHLDCSSGSGLRAGSQPGQLWLQPELGRNSRKQSAAAAAASDGRGGDGAAAAAAAGLRPRKRAHREVVDRLDAEASSSVGMQSGSQQQQAVARQQPVPVHKRQRRQQQQQQQQCTLQHTLSGAGGLHAATATGNAAAAAAGGASRAVLSHCFAGHAAAATGQPRSTQDTDQPAGAAAGSVAAAVMGGLAGGTTAQQQTGQQRRDEQQQWHPAGNQQQQEQQQDQEQQWQLEQQEQEQEQQWQEDLWPVDDVLWDAGDDPGGDALEFDAGPDEPAAADAGDRPPAAAHDEAAAAAAAAATGPDSISPALLPTAPPWLHEVPPVPGLAEAAAVEGAAQATAAYPAAAVDPAAAAAVDAAPQATPAAAAAAAAGPAVAVDSAAAAAAVDPAAVLDAAAAAEFATDHIHPDPAMHANGYRLGVPGSQLRFLAENMGLQLPAAVVLTAMAAYYAAVSDLEGRHIGLGNCCYAAHLPSMSQSHSWPTGLNEEHVYVEQDALGFYLLSWNAAALGGFANGSTHAGAAVLSSSGSSSQRSKRGRKKKQPQQPVVPPQPLLATFAWPLKLAGSGGAAASGSSPAHTANNFLDMVVVALPGGVTTDWGYDAAAAAAAFSAVATGRHSQQHPTRSGSHSGGSSRAKTAQHNSGSSVRAWFEVPYCALWQYKSERSTMHRYFLATSWAALWPVFVREAVKHSTILLPQAKAQLDGQLTAVWQSYQQGLCALKDLNFPNGDGSQLLPPASVFKACSAERTPASCAGDEPAAAAAGAAGACPASAAAAAAASAGGPCDQEGSSSFKGSGQGLWARLHSVYFRDTEKTVPRSPYDLACDKKLWAYDAYESISDALEQVEVAPQHKAAALKAIADPADRALALRSLKRY